MDLSGSFQQKQLICQEHKKQIEYIYLKDDANSKLACGKCFLMKQLEHKYIIEIESLIDQKQETIFNNLPPGFSQELYQKLISNDIQESNKEALIEEISKEFKRFGEQIASVMEQHKKQLINHINQTDEERISALKTYDIVASKEDLCKKIMELSNDHAKLDKYVKDLISAKKNTAESDKKKIEDQLEKHKNLALKIDVQHIHNCLLTLLEKIRSTNFFIGEDNSQQQQQQQNQQLMSNPIISKQIICPPPSPIIQKQIKINSIEQLLSTNNLEQYGDIYLHLYEKGIGDVEMEQISKCLYGCQWTTKLALNLRNNDIANKGIMSLFQALHQMKSLCQLTLWLDNNPKITEEGYSELTKPLSCYSHQITYLDLSFSKNKNVSDKAVSSILTVISTYSQLSYLKLHLYKTQITGNTVKQIANSIQSLTHLTELYLNIYDNEIEDDNAFILLSNAISQYLNQSLIKVTLQLSNNKIGNNAALSLVNAITNCPKLKYLFLDLRDNKIEKQCIQQIEQIKQNLKTNYCLQLNDLLIYLD